MIWCQTCRQGMIGTNSRIGTHSQNTASNFGSSGPASQAGATIRNMKTNFQISSNTITGSMASGRNTPSAQSVIIAARKLVTTAPDEVQSVGSQIRRGTMLTPSPTAIVR